MAARTFAVSASNVDGFEFFVRVIERFANGAGVVEVISYR
jgi:hypothetical protein